MTDTETTKPEKEFKISQYFGYVGPFIIFLGMTRLITFYKAFGVSIVSYLDFSEIITSFFDILSIVFLFFAYTTIQNFVMSDKRQADETHKKQQEILNQDDLPKLFRLYLVYFKSLLIYGLIVILGCTISCLVFHWVKPWTLFITVAIFILIIFFLIVTVEIERKHIYFQSSINKRWFIFLTLYFLVFTMGVVYYSSYEAGLIKKDKLTFGVAITLDNDKTIISDSTNYFIGKTLHYLFIYHQKQNSTDIIPMTRVKQITMINKSN